MRLIVNERAEALYIYPSAAPVLEVNRKLHRLEGAKLTPAGVDELFYNVTDTGRCSEFERNGMVSFSHRFDDTAVFQIIAFREDGHARLQIRRLDVA